MTNTSEPRPPVELSCIESFSGAGGLALGLKQAGFTVGVAFDIDSPSIDTMHRNLPEMDSFVGDVRDISGRSLLKRAGLRKGELDLFAGGPPCQGFSKQKRGAHLGDERNNLVLEWARIISETHPRFVLIENVAMFGQKRGKEFIAEIKARLTNYYVYPHFFTAADYGVAQTRQRFIMVGRRKDVDVPFSLPRPTHAGKWPTIRDAIGDLPEPPDNCKSHDKYYNHYQTRITALNRERISHVPQGGGWQDIPYELRLPCHQTVNTKSGGWPDVYGRLSWDGQCPTITGGFDSFTRGRYGHPVSNRAITPREAARIQGFPDDFEFMGNKSEVRSQIGNAVPPPLGRAVGHSIYESLLIYHGYRSADSVPIPDCPEYEQETLFA